MNRLFIPFLRSLNRPPLLTGLALALTLLPPLLLLQTTAKFGVDMPYLDSWNLAPSVVRLHTTGLSFADFLIPQNEHPVFFPRLLILGAAAAAGWDLERDIYFCIGLLALTLLGLASLVRITVPPGPRALLVMLSSLLLFSEVQMPLNNSFNIVWDLLDATAVGAVTALSRWPGKWKGLLLAMAAAVIATYSLISGAALWLAVLPALLAPGGRWKKRQVLAWLAAGGFCLIHIGFIYISQPRPGQLSFLQFLPYISFFFLSWLGAPLALWGGEYLAAGTGFAGLALLIFSAWYLRRTLSKAGRQFQPEIVPWLLLALFTLLSGAAAALGRVSVRVSLQSRYTTTSLLFWVALAVLLVRAWLLFYPHTSNRRKRYALVAAALSGLISAGFYSRAYNYGHSAMVQTAANLEFSYYFAFNAPPVPGPTWYILYDLTEVPYDAKPAALKRVREGPFRLSKEAGYEKLAEKWRSRLAPLNNSRVISPGEGFTILNRLNLQAAPEAANPDFYYFSSADSNSNPAGSSGGDSAGSSSSNPAGSSGGDSAGAAPVEVKISNALARPGGLLPDYESQVLELALDRAWYVEANFSTDLEPDNTVRLYGLPGPDTRQYFRLFLPGHFSNLTLKLYYREPAADQLGIKFYSRASSAPL